MIRYALRQVLRSRWLTIAAVSCIGLGAAATASVITLVGAALFRPLPFPDADRLVRLWWSETGGNPRVEFSLPEIADLQTLASIDRLLGVGRVRAIAALPTGTERLRGEAVPVGYFDALGLRPRHGRWLDASDAAPGAASAIVLSHATWQRAYGADPAAIGATLTTGQASYTIVGVGPAGFSGTIEQDVVEFWIPVSQYEPASLLTDRHSRLVWIIGRPATGATIHDVRRDAATLTARLRERHPDVYRDLAISVEPLGENWRAGLRGSAWLLAGAALLLLVVAMVNVAGLLLVRVQNRRREFAVAASLGASRAQIAGQVLVETMLIVGAGSVIGVLSAPWVLRAFFALSPVSLPGYVDVSPDPLVVLVSIAVLGAAGLVAGLVPAMASSQVRPIEALALAGRSNITVRGDRRWGSAIIAIESALTIVLLVVGALMLRSWQSLEQAQLGYQVDGIARLAITLGRSDVPATEGIVPAIARLRDAIAREAGVDRVGFVWPTLPPWDAERTRVHLRGAAFDAIATPTAGLHLADDGLFRALDIEVIAGSRFDPVVPGTAIVSDALAERLGGAARVLGQHIVLPHDPHQMNPSGEFRVIGIAGNVAYDGLGEQDTGRYIRYGDPADPRGARFDVYLPLLAMPQRLLSIAVRTRGDEAAELSGLRRALADVAPGSAVHWTSTMAEELGREFAPSRFYAVLVTAFSTSALLLTTVGLFAVMSYGVHQRRAEFGLRIALGARPRAIAALVVATGARPLAAGSVLGVIAAAGGTSALGSLLYGVPASDPWSYAGAVATLLLAAVPAHLLPLRHARR